jgi:hypothetical protein
MDTILEGGPDECRGTTMKREAVVVAEGVGSIKVPSEPSQRPKTKKGKKFPSKVA